MEYNDARRDSKGVGWPHAMQIHISWKTLIATLIFTVGIVLLLRLTLSQASPTPSVVAQPPTEATELPTDVGVSVVPPVADPNAPTATVAAVAELPSATPTEAQVEPSVAPTAEALPPTATLEPTPTPEATLPPPTPTLAPPPTRVPTPTPAQLILVDQGFGQNQAQMSYAFIISNPNPDLLAQAVRYQVAAYDANGVVLLTNSDTIAQIGPGQDIGIAKTMPLGADLTIARIEVLFRPGQFIRSPPLQTLSVSNPAFVVGVPPNITGVVSNSFDRDLVEVSVVGIAYDDSGIIGGGSSSVPFIPARGQAAVSIPIATNQTATRVSFWVELINAP
jgi:hypothetical protein